MTILSCNEIEIYYDVDGQGVPLMLIAGLASDSQSWQTIMPELTSHYRIIATDNRGSGRTVPQDAEISIAKLAGDCIEVIRHLGFSSINLLGHSMGGFVAQYIAIHYPEYVNKLILAATSSSNSKRNNTLFSDMISSFYNRENLEQWYRNIFYWLFTADFFENEKSVNETVRSCIQYPYLQSPDAFRNQITAIADFNSSAELSEITAETLVIAGDQDLLFPIDVCRDFAKRIPSGTLSVIKNAAHSIHSEQPSAFCKCIINFLS